MIDLIKAATLTNNRELQKNAENTILKQRNQRPEYFFIQNSLILQQKDIEANIRQAACALLIGALKLKINDKYLWYSLSVPNRSTFKDVVLGILLDQDKAVRRAAANIVAAICCIEIPRNQWEGIAQKITANIRSENDTVKEVSILTIGFICEQLKDFNFYFQESLQEPILTAILFGLKENQQIAITAFKALRDGMPAFSGIMKHAQYRQYLITQLVQALKVKAFIQLALQCLIEFIKFYYALMQNQYVIQLAKFIDPFLKNTAEEIFCVLAMEFWANLAKEQKNIQSNPNLMKFLTGELGQHLVQVLLANLCIVEADDEEGNGISQAAASTLQAIFTDNSVEFQLKILNFTSNTIHHQNWKLRQASIRAFALLLIGLPPQRSQSLVNVSLLQLVSLINDSQPFVQLSAVKALSLISEEVPEVILHHQHFFAILQLVVRVVSIGDQFLKNACRIIDNLTVPEQSTKFIGAHAVDLLKFFLSICLSSTSSNASINSCFNTIINLIKSSKNTTICKEYLNLALTTFPKIHSLEHQKRDIFYSGFFTIAQVCLMTIRKVNSSITMDQLSSLYNLVVQHYNKIKNVEGDGFYLVSALAYFIPNDRRLVDDFWKYVQQGLKKLNQDEIFKSTISCICDFTTIYRDQISDKVDQVIVYVIELYEKNLITRELKLDVLMCIGEIYLHCGDFCLKHLKKVMDLLLLSCEGVLTVVDLNYAEILQQSIIETLMCILHGVQDIQGKKILAQSLPFIMEFIRLTTQNNRHPKLEYVKECLMLLADIINILPSQAAQLSKCTFISDRVMTLIKFNKDGHLNQCINYVKQQFRITL